MNEYRGCSFPIKSNPWHVPNLSLPLNSHLFRPALSVIQIDNAHKISCFKKSYERTTINEPEMRPTIKNIYPINVFITYKYGRIVK